MQKYFLYSQLFFKTSKVFKKKYINVFKKSTRYCIFMVGAWCFNYLDLNTIFFFKKAQFINLEYYNIFKNYFYF